MSQPAQKEVAKARFIVNESIQSIADALSVSRRTVERWADEGDWRTLRQNNDNVVQISAIANVNRAQTQAKSIPRSKRKVEEFDALELVDDAIVVLSGALPGDIDPRALGGIANSLKNLLEYRRKLCPPTAGEIAEMAMEAGITPDDFIKELQSAWKEQRA